MIILHLVGGGGVPNGVISMWDKVLVASRSGACYCLFARVS